jgi:hypothetical protein
MERLMAAATHEEREQERARLEAALSLERERFQAERLEQEQRLEKRLEESEARLKEEVMERDRQLAELAEEKERLEERFKEERDQLQERLNALQQKLGKIKTWLEEIQGGKGLASGGFFDSRTQSTELTRGPRVISALSFIGGVLIGARALHVLNF